MGFDTIWTRIVEHQGESFHTVKNIEFTYQVIDDYVLTTRTKQRLYKSEFLKAYEFGRLEYPGQINNIVRGSSYIFAILTDSRIHL